MQGIEDSYYYLLDNPDGRSLAVCGKSFEHKTASFDQSVYERSRGRMFASADEAYLDWLRYGRTLGLEFAEGKNTILKVILKVKDEPDLLPHWLAYYESIIGAHNIVIIDCGSTDPDHLKILESCRDRILTFRFNGAYDELHDVVTHRELYALVCRNCKYVALLDADEFVFGYSGGEIGRRQVLSILRDGSEGAFAGTWFPNLSVPVNEQGQITFAEPIRFNIDQHILIFGTVAGKSVLRSDVCMKVRNIGHNLHVKDTVSHFTASSFGRIGVLHITRLGARITKGRALKHLYAKGVLPRTVATDHEISAALTRGLDRKELQGIEAHYARKYLGLELPDEVSNHAFTTSILATESSEKVKEFSNRVDTFDFTKVVERHCDCAA